MRLIYAANWVTTYLVAVIFGGSLRILQKDMPTREELTALWQWSTEGTMLRAVLCLIMEEDDLMSETAIESVKTMARVALAEKIDPLTES